MNRGISAVAKAIFALQRPHQLLGLCSDQPQWGLREPDGGVRTFLLRGKLDALSQPNT
jgi:hypothetical protein